MPLSIIIGLEHDFPLPKQHLGRQFQGWFFDKLPEINPSLADRLHVLDQKQGYTLSTAFPANQHAGSERLQKNLSHLRLTILDDSLRDFFIFEFLPQMGPEIHILWMDFKPASFVYSDHLDARAGFLPYAQLARDGGNHQQKKVTMAFVSPTVFRSNDQDIPLPEPGRIYRNLQIFWNAFAPQALAIEDDWLDFAREAIVINRIYHLKTERLRFAGGQRGAATGFVGRIEFSLLSPNHLDDKWAAYFPQGQSIFLTLSAFAFFCGVGARTTIGMGQTYPEIS